MGLTECKPRLFVLLTSDRFLLARLRLERVIGKGNVPVGAHMDQRSKELQGTTVPEIYQDIMKDIRDIGEHTTTCAFKALGWIRYAKEPLTARALEEAINESTEMRVSSEDILRICMSLVVLSESQFFQFSHTTTVTEFLDAGKFFEGTQEGMPSQLHLAKRCLSYLDSPSFESLPVGNVSPWEKKSVIRLYGFGGYAARNWAEHVREVEGQLLGRGKEDLSYFQFLAAETKRHLMLKLNAQTITSTMLHFIAEKGISKLCSVCFKTKAR